MSHLPDLVQQAKDNAINEENAHWQEATGALLEPANALVTAINEGLEHAGLQLGLVHPRSKRTLRSGHKDTESQGDMVHPGDPKFSTYLEGKLNEFSRGRLQSLSAWTSGNGASEKEEKGSSRPSELIPEYAIDTPKDHRQLNLVLYTHQMVGQQSTPVPRSYTDNINCSCTQRV
jgi:hypothetical protein